MRYLNDPRWTATAVLITSAAILLAAVAFQYVGGLQPCVLCIYQRYPYGVTIAASAVAVLLAVSGKEAPARAALGLCGIAFLIGAAVAIFHVGVEQHWWAGTSECGGAASAAATVEDLKRQLMAQEVVRCDAVAWSFLGISMAGWNALLSFGLAGLSLLAALTSGPNRALHARQHAP